MITYKKPTKKQKAKGLEEHVLLEGKIVGAIRWMGSGFSYIPKGTVFGEIFERVSEVKNLIEAE